MKLNKKNWPLKIKSAHINIHMAKIENLMSDLKSGGESYLRNIYTQEYNFIKIFFIGCLRQIDKIREKNGYWLFNNSGKRFF